MMGIPPSEAKQLSLYEYQALLHNWELAHSNPEDAPLEPPDKETIERRRARLEKQGIVVL